MGALKIGDLSKRAGVSTDTIRYYERSGLLLTPPRSANGYRQYSEGAVHRLRLISSALRFGFSIKEVARFLHERDAGTAPCRQVRAAAEELLREMDATIEEMIATRESMREILHCWDERLQETPAGKPARLLELLPPAAVARPRLATRAKLRRSR